MTPRQLEQTLENETSLSRAYFIFFRQMGWIKGATESGEWRLTEKGRATLAHLLGNERPTQKRRHLTDFQKGRAWTLVRADRKGIGKAYTFGNIEAER